MYIDWFFIFGGLGALTLGTVISKNSIADWNLISFSASLIFFLATYLLQRYSQSLSKSKTIREQSNSFAKPGLKPLQYIPAFFLLALILTSLYFLLKQQVLIGINLIFLSLIAFLTFSQTSNRPGHPAKLLTWLFKSLIISPLLLVLGISVQAVPLTSLHYLLALPLLFLSASSFVALSFPQYANAPSEHKQTLIPTIGLEQTVTLHNVLILLAYLGLGAYLFFSGTFRTNWTLILITLISFAQMFLLHRILLGMKPNYGLLKTTAVLQTLTFIYLLVINTII